MAVTIQIFTLFLGVVIVMSHPLQSDNQPDDYLHQDNFPDFLHDIVSGLGSLFQNSENPHILENRILPQIYGGVGFFDSGVYDKGGLQQDGFTRPINFNGGIGQGVNNVPSLNPGTDSVERNYSQGGNNLEANVADQNVVNNDQTSDILDKKSHVSGVPLNNDNVIERAKTNGLSNESKVNVVPDNQEGKNINVNEGLNTVAKESISQNDPDEKKDKSNAIELEKIVTGLDDDNIEKGILMIGPEFKINDTDVGLNKYTDAIVFPDANSPVPIYVSGNSGANNPGQVYESGNFGANNPGQDNLPGNSAVNNPGQVYTTGNSGSINSGQVNLPSNSGANNPGQIYVPVNYGVNTASQVYIPGNSGTNNPGQVYVLANSGANNLDQGNVPSNSGTNNPIQGYVLSNSGANNLGQINVPGNSGTNNPGQVYVLGNSGTFNPSQVNIPSNSVSNNLGQINVPGNSGFNSPGQVYVFGNSGNNNPNQINVPANSGTNIPGLVYILGNSGTNNPNQINVPGNSGTNNPGQVYVLGNSGNNNPNQINVPDNSVTNKPGQFSLLVNSGAYSPGQVNVPGNSGQIYSSNNAPGSSGPTTNGVYYILIKLNNGQTILIPTNSKPYVSDNGPNSQTNNGQTNAPVNYNPVVTMPNGQGYVVLGNNPSDNAVNLGNPGNVMTNQPSNNVPLLISYKDKDGEQKSAEEESESKIE